MARPSAPSIIIKIKRIRVDSHTTPSPPDNSLIAQAGVSTPEAIHLLRSSADLTIKLDAQGIIHQVELSAPDRMGFDTGQWIGRRWEDVVTKESRPKVRELLQGDAPSLWRHINFSTSHEVDAPFEIALVRSEKPDTLYALGRDLSGLAALQQRLVDAQQSLERDYLRLRHLETRYRALFQTVSDAVLIVDATTHDVVEGNPAAFALLDRAPKFIVGVPLAQCFANASEVALSNLLSSVRASGKTGTLALKTFRNESVQCSVMVFRQEERWFFLIRLAPSSLSSAVALDETTARLAELIDRGPDAVVLTDDVGRIQRANAAFADMVQLQGPQALPGEGLERFLGRAQVDLNVLLGNLRQHGTVRLFATNLRSQYASILPVEISAVRLSLESGSIMGFFIRDISRRLEREPQKSKELPRTAAQLTDLVGRVPLKDIVSETTDLIEQLCIEAALQLTRDNRASAAEMLGLSRQSLYVKLRRFGLGDLGGDSET
jgi:transcriptional regulator PpsR